LESHRKAICREFFSNWVVHVYFSMLMLSIYLFSIKLAIDIVKLATVDAMVLLRTAVRYNDRIYFFFISLSCRH
jgi:hypothetical protein